jgi:hypothetical protein
MRLLSMGAHGASGTRFVRQLDHRGHRVKGKGGP